MGKKGIIISIIAVIVVISGGLAFGHYSKLKSARSAAASELSSAVNYTDYRPERATEIKDIIKTATGEINQAKNAEDIEKIRQNAMNSIRMIETDAEMTAAEQKVALAQAKDDAISAIRTAVGENTYRSAEEKKVKALQKEYSKKINAATDSEKVFRLKKEAIDKIRAVKTEDDYAAEEAEAKRKAKAEAKKKAEAEAKARAEAAKQVPQQTAPKKSSAPVTPNSNGCVGKDARNFY